jgi:hypothetical protein
VTEDVQHAFEEDRDVLNAVQIGMANKSSPHIDLPIDSGQLRFRRHRNHKYVGALWLNWTLRLSKNVARHIWRRGANIHVQTTSGFYTFICTKPAVSINVLIHEKDEIADAPALKTDFKRDLGVTFRRFIYPSSPREMRCSGEIKKAPNTDNIDTNSVCAYPSF